MPRGSTIPVTRGVFAIPNLARRAGIIAVTRLANQALILFSPLILVRLLSVAEFGRYREFLLYVGLLAALCAFGINNSLMYFVPARPENAWRFVRQAVVLTAFNSLVGVLLLVTLDTLSGGAVVGEYLAPVCLYTLLFVNVDFWEFLWLGLKRPGAVFVYSSGRVLARMTVVIVAAGVSGDVNTIITALIALEALRLAVSIVVWRRMARGAEHAVAGSWREQLRFCTPVGTALVLVTANKSLGGLFVAKAMGPVALAHYTIGTYVEPIISVLRNSISDALLPEMAARDGKADADPLHLWRRTTVVSAILLLPAAVLLHRYAAPLVATLFSNEYLPAAVVVQIYVLTFIRECFDFGVLLRAINRTAPMVAGNVAAVVANLVLLAVLIPPFGLAGAVSAFVFSRFLDAAYLAWRTLDLFDVRLRELACWGDLARVVAATAVAAVPIYAFDWLHAFGLVGIVPALVVFAATFALALRVLRLPEAVEMFRRLRQPLGARP